MPAWFSMEKVTGHSEVHGEWRIVTDPMRVALVDLMQQRQRRRKDAGYTPAADSRAVSELAATTHLAAYVRTPTEVATSTADLMLAAAEDHFGALCRLIEHETPTLFAHKVLARAGIEACARAAWLLDPNIDAMSRAMRGLTQRFASINANRELAKGDLEARAWFAEARDQLAEQCRRAGFTVERFDGTAAIGDKIPSERRLMRDLFGSDPEIDLGDFSQTWLSQVVHGEAAALMDAMTDDEILPRLATGTQLRGLMATSTDANIVMAACTLAYLLAGERFLRHQGWLDEEWTRVVRNLRQIMRHALGVDE